MNEEIIYVRELTLEQKNLLEGQVWGFNGQIFAPLQDADGKWFTSNETVLGCTLSQAQAIGCDSWLLSLPSIPYNPIAIEI